MSAGAKCKTCGLLVGNDRRMCMCGMREVVHLNAAEMRAGEHALNKARRFVRTLAPADFVELSRALVLADAATKARVDFCR